MQTRAIGSTVTSAATTTNPRDKAGAASQPAGRMYFTALSSLLACALAFAPTVAEAAKKPKNNRKIDRALTEALDRNGGSTVRVILRVAPGKSADVRAALARKNKHASAEHSLIGGLTAEVDVNDLADLADDANVESVSIDAPIVADGLVTAAAGSALNSDYSLRATLGLTTLGAAVTRTFQQGVSAYNAAVDGGVNSASGGTNYGNATSVKVEVSSSSKSGMLMRFDSLFGTGSGQIPYGSTVTVASLKVSTVSNGSTSGSTGLYRMRLNVGGAGAFLNTQTASR